MRIRATSRLQTHAALAALVTVQQRSYLRTHRPGGAPAPVRRVMPRRQEAAQGCMSPAGHACVPGAVRAPFCPATGACGASCSLLAGWQPGAIPLQQQASLWGIPVAHRLPFASGEGPERCPSWWDMGRGEPLPGRRDGGLVRKGRAPPCVCACGSRAHAGIDLRDGLTTTPHAHEAWEPLGIGSVHEACWLPLALVASGSKDMAGWHVLAQSSERSKLRVAFHI